MINVPVSGGSWLGLTDHCHLPYHSGFLSVALFASLRCPASCPLCASASLGALLGVGGRLWRGSWGEPTSVLLSAHSWLSGLCKGGQSSSRVSDKPLDQMPTLPPSSSATFQPGQGCGGREAPDSRESNFAAAPGVYRVRARELT